MAPEVGRHSLALGRDVDAIKIHLQDSLNCLEYSTKLDATLILPWSIIILSKLATIWDHFHVAEQMTRLHMKAWSAHQWSDSNEFCIQSRNRPTQTISKIDPLMRTHRSKAIAALMVNLKRSKVKIWLREFTGRFTSHHSWTGWTRPEGRNPINSP